MSAPSGTGFTGGAAGSSQSNIRGTLTNTTSAATTATYIVTPVSGTCTGQTFTVTVSLLPKAIMAAQMTATTCSGVAFDFTPVDGFSGNILPSGTTFTWPTPTGVGLTGGLSQAAGTDHIFGTFVNTTNIARTATYSITPLSGVCTGNTYTVTVTINPIVNIASTTPQFVRTICSGTMFGVTPVNGTNGIVPSATLYRWSAPAMTGTLTGGAASSNVAAITGTLNNPGTTAETATYIVTPSTSCGDGASFTVVVQVNPLAIITPMSTTICGGAPFTVTPTNGVNGVIPTVTTYTWLALPTGSGFTGGVTRTGQASISGTLTNTVNAARTATYLITPTSAGCNGPVFSVTVNINPTAQITAMTNVICNGSSFTSTPADIVNGIVPSGSTYTWLAPTGTGFTGGMTGAGPSITGTLANSTSIAHSATYIVTPTSGSCAGATFTVTVTVNPIAAVTDMTTTVCSGVTFSSTAQDIVNGTIPAGTLYSWNAPVAPGIAGGASQISAISSVTGLLINTTTSAAVAVYTVTPTSNGCTGAQFTLTVTVNPSAQVTPMSTTVCGGSPFTVIPTHITDGRVPPATTYSWLALPTGVGFTGGATATGAANITGTLLNTVNTLRTATYLVTPLTGGCTGAVFSVTVNVNPLAQVSSMTTITCSGTSFNLSPANGINGIVPTGISYSWTVFSVTGGLTGATSGSGQPFISGTLLNPTSTQQTATYTVIPATTTCGDGPAFTVTVSVNPTATVTVPLSVTTCGGVSFTITPTDVTHGNLPAGTRFSWSLPTGSGFTGGISASNALAITGLLTNTTATVTTAFYSVTTVSGACAGAPFTVTVTLNPKAIISAMTGTTCSGTAFAVTPVSIVPSGTTYSWIMPTGSNLTGFATGSGQPDINGTLINGVNVARTATYTVTPVSGSCTGNVFSIVVTVNPRANITAMTAITCSGVAFTVTPTNLTNGIVPGATLYSWANPSTTGSLTGFTGSGSTTSVSGVLVNTSNVAQTATYIVTPTSACGNGPAFTVTVTVNPAASINTIGTATCSGITFTVTPTHVTDGTIPAGTTYTWSIPSVTGGITGGAARGTASATVFGLLTNPTHTVQTATYTVTPLSGNCTGAQFSVVVTLNPSATVTTMTSTICSGTSFTLTPVQTTNGIVPSGTTYTWIAPSAASITGAVSESGSANIYGTLVNTSNIARTITYAVVPTSGSCTGAAFSVVVRVDPTPTVPNFLGLPACSGVVSFTPTGALIPTNTTYTWPAPTGTGYSGGQAQLVPTTQFLATIASTTNISVTPTYFVTPVSGSCQGAGFTVTIDLRPNPIISPLSVTTCSGVTFSVSPTDGVNGVVPAGSTYTWSAVPTGTGFTGASTQAGSADIHGTLTNTTNAAVTATYTVFPYTGTCPGAAFTVTVTINPAASVTVMTAVTCTGTTFSVTPTNLFNGIVPAGTTYSWSSPTVTGTLTGGAAMSGATNITGALSHSNTTAQTATYLVTPYTAACGYHTPFTVTVTIHPLAAITAITGTACSGVAFSVTPVNVTNGIVPAGTVYTWLAPTGTGFTGGVSHPSTATNISGILTNTTSSSTTVTYSVTPGTGACTGTAFSLVMTLNPAATVTPMTATICSGATFTVTPSDITNGIVPAGTTYSWNAPVATGITGAVSGSGAASITGTLVNTTSIARTITYTVTPLSGSCSGNAFTVTVTVEAKASVSQITAISASNATFTVTPADGTHGVVPAGTTYSWLAPVVTGGLTGGASGVAASSISGTLVNPTNTSQTATYIVTPASGNCTGAAFTVVVTIRPLASINALTVTTCSGVAFSITPTDPANGTVPPGTLYSWSAPTGTGFTGGASASSQTTIGGTLVNTTTQPVTATYLVTPRSAGYDGVPFTVTVTVNPNPVLSSTLTPADICSGSPFVYTATSATTGASFTWSRTTVTGIVSSGAATGTGTSINQSLTNSTTSPLTVNYVFAITANGCTNPSAGSVAIVVNPIPVLSSSLTPADIYNATTFNYTATSLTPGTTFAWTRPAIAAINSNTTGSGVGANITEVLTTTNPSLTAVVYAITLTANGCVNAQTITVNVSPTPGLNSPLNPAAICSGTVFAYTATSATPGTTFTWTRAAIASINANGTGSGSTGTINETLTNSSNVPVSVVYTVLLTANSFTNTQNVTVVVNPTPSVTQPGAQVVCNNSLTANVIFTGSVSGTVYNWSNNNTAIGLAASGSGTINAFTATNSTSSVITGIITVTPVSNTCSGPATSFTYTVSPTPVLSSSLTPTGICTGNAFSYTATSATAGTSFAWSRTTVGLLTAGGPATGTGNITGQTHINNTTAPVNIQYVYTLTANGCTNIQNVTLAVNPTPVLSSTLTPTAVFGGTAFVYTPTSVTSAVTFSWSRATMAGISNAAATGTGTINESLINTTASPISVVYAFTSTAAGCSSSQTVTVSIIPSNIDAVYDDFRATCIDGGKGGKTTTVLANDILNSTVVDPTLVNMSIVSDGGITGLTINSLGELVIPAKTFEGTYTVTYNICVTANPGNCDQATATITVCRGLFITTTAVCRNDVPYVHYKVETNFIPATGNPVTLKWLNGDKTVLAAQPIVNGTALEADVLWPGAVVDSAGKPTDWPGWFIQNGIWVAGADGFEGTRPNAYLVVSVNPTDTVLLSYPPATPGCVVNPVNRPPVAVDDRDSTGQCSVLVLNVLNNDADFENGVLTVSLPSSTSLHNGTAVVNANGTISYTPPTNYVGVDKFTYTITDAAGATASATVTITVASKPQIVGGIAGVCALSKDSSGVYSVSPVANATSYLWTLPAGWTGSSLTNTITVKAGSANGTITVVPYNGGCAGSPVSYNVSIIDFAKVTITSSPSVVKGDGIATSEVTISLFDPNGNPIHCSGGTATLCTSSGVFSDVIDNGDGTYTGYLRSSANSAIICGTVAGKRIEQTVTTTFTGPQGSIKGNGPIFETETPLLTFNFTAGIGPFTVIYKPQGATKNDTLTNVVSNVPIPVKSISATKLYTMVSIIGSDNARRDNNFTRDTATILVVEPKIIITLTADNPKFLADNLYSTILRLKVRNNGDIDLSNVQVRANLLEVFPNPVQFVLDSVKQFGRQTVPNSRYDGRSNFDLFAWHFNSTPGLRNNMNDIAAVQVPAMAFGNSGYGNSGMNTDDAAGDRTQIPFLPGHSYNSEKENAGTTGNNDGPLTTPFFFGALSKLDVGEESDMQMFIRIIPNGYFKPFVMQAVAVGTGHTEFGTALANSLSNDDGNEAVHPENTRNGDPLPTVINVFPNPVLGVAMKASTPALQGNGTYNVTLSYVLKNYGNVNLRQVKLFEELTRSIGTPATFSIVSAPVATGNLLANPLYNGTTDTSMLAPNSSIAVGTDATVSVTINITPNQLSALYRAFAIGTGFCSELGNTVTDISSNGTDPDPDGNGVPDERLITLIPINMSIPPLVPGTIGIRDTPSTTVLTKTLCESTAVTVVTTVAPTGGLDVYTYQWQSSTDNITFTAIAGATASTYTGTVTSSVYLRRMVTSGDQVAYSNSVRLIINPIAKPVITPGGPLNLTQSGSITLSSSSASAYLWSTNATTNTITVSTAGAYTVTITDANGCKATSDLVAINPPPPTTVNRTYVIGGIGNPPNSGIQVTGLAGATLKYYLVSTGGTVIPVPVLPGVIGTYPYYVSQVVNGYESVLVPYTVTMIAPSQLADIEKVTSQKPLLQADGSYIVNFTIRTSNITAVQLDSVKIRDDLRAVFPAGVQFDVVGVKTSGKLIANELYNGNTQIELLADGSVLPANQKDSVILSVKVTPNGFSGQLKNTAIQVAKSPYGVFSVTSNDPLLSNGVTSRAPTEFVIPATDIFIPSGFSPNRDGVNDVFVITRPFNTTINMEIYNRWGNLVYRSRDYKNDWGGKGNQPNNILGEDLPDGTYYYVVLATDNATGNVRKFAAFITLKR